MNTSRRQFVRGSLACLAAGGVLPHQVFGIEGKIRRMPASKVVIVRHGKAIDAAGNVSHAIVQQMLDEAMVAFTGKSTAKDAWNTVIKPKDIVGLKINTLGLMSIKGTALVSHYSAVNVAIAGSLKAAGVPDGNLIVWDRTDGELINAGLTLQKEAGSLRVMGTEQKHGVPNIGYSAETYPIGDKSSRVSRILTEGCTVCINVPLLKAMGGTGISGCLKNHYGTIDNPRELHANHCTNPGIPEVNAIPVIRQKQRLIICDALLGLFEGGPWWQAANTWPFGGLIVGTDPVAVDTVVRGILNEKREIEKLPSNTDRSIHIDLSAKLGLGNDNLSNITVVRKNLG